MKRMLRLLCLWFVLCAGPLAAGAELCARLIPILYLLSPSSRAMLAEYPAWAQEVLIEKGELLVRDGGYTWDQALASINDNGLVGGRLLARLKDPSPPAWYVAEIDPKFKKQMKHWVWLSKPIKISQVAAWSPQTSALRTGSINQSRQALLENEVPAAEHLTENGFDVATRPRTTKRDADVDVFDPATESTWKIEIKKVDGTGDKTIKNAVMRSLKDSKNHQGQSDYLLIDARSQQISGEVLENNIRGIAGNLIEHGYQKRLHSLEVITPDFHHLFVFVAPKSL